MSLPPGISGHDRTFLLAQARKALKVHLMEEAPSPPPVSEPGDPDLPHHGVFVTLRHRGELRGCIGNLDGRAPLAASVRSCVLSAAEDPRFEPLSCGELEDLSIEISVLGPGRPVGEAEEIRIGLDGLIVRKGGCRGLLLPQVAVEHGWDAARFLEEVCRKAGLPPDAWSSGGAEVEAFGAEAFSEASGATAAPPDRRC